MVATAEMMRRIETDIRSIRAETDFLPELEAGWADETDTDRFVWYDEWRDLMARLQDLDGACASGVMTEEQQGRYHELLLRLKAAVPILVRLDLPPPPVRLPA